MHIRNRFRILARKRVPSLNSVIHSLKKKKKSYFNYSILENRFLTESTVYIYNALNAYSEVCVCLRVLMYIKTHSEVFIKSGKNNRKLN